jgi:hypothetical protein
MPVTVTKLLTPFGSDVFFGDGVAKVGYRLTGDGTNGAVNLPFGKLESVISVEADQNHDPQINNTTKVVTLTIPAAASGGLANGDFVDVWLRGKGGH